MPLMLAPSMGGKPGGLQEAINRVTAENSPGANTQALDFITRYIQQSPTKGSEKALKYLKKRFDVKHVKVQNLTLIVLDTCQQRCGHMFRDRVPGSEMFAEMIKVATLKRTVDVQIHNKVLALIEDWADALGTPAYKQAHHQLQMGSVQFPNRVGRDLSEYRHDDAHGLGGQNHMGRSPYYDSTPGNSHPDPAGPPSAFGRDGHFVPNDYGAQLKAKEGKGGIDGGLPENMLAAGQSSNKLQEDLTAARNSVDLLAEILAPITSSEPAAVKQDLVKEMAERCETMLPKLATLAEEVSDEKTLDRILVLHADMEESVAKYHALLQTAEGKPTAPVLQSRSLSQKLAAKSVNLRAATEQTISAQPKAASPKKEAAKVQVNLLDWDDEPSNANASTSQPVAAPVPAAAAAAASSVGPPTGGHPIAAAHAQPAPSATDFNSLMSLFDAPQQPYQANLAQPTTQQQGPPASGGFGAPAFTGQTFGQPSAPATGFNQPNFGPPSAGTNAGGGFGQPNFEGPPSAGPYNGGGFGPASPFGPGSFPQSPSFAPQLQLQSAAGQSNPGWQGAVPQQQPPQTNPFGGASGPAGPTNTFNGAPPRNELQQATSAVLPGSAAGSSRPQARLQSSGGGGPQEGFGTESPFTAFSTVPHGQPQQPEQRQQGFGGFTEGQTFGTNAPPQQQQQQQQQQQRPQEPQWAQNFGTDTGPSQWNSAKSPQQQQQQQQQQPPGAVSFQQPAAANSGFASGDLAAFSGKPGVKGPSSLTGSVGSVNPFDDPPPPAKLPIGGAKMVPSKLGAGGAAPKPSWSPTVPAEDDPFSSVGPSFGNMKAPKA